MNDDNPNQPAVTNEVPAAMSPQPVPVDDVRPPVKMAPPLDKSEEFKTETTSEPKPPKMSVPKSKSALSTSIMVTVIIVFVIAALIVYAYFKSK